MLILNLLPPRWGFPFSLTHIISSLPVYPHTPSHLPSPSLPEGTYQVHVEKWENNIEMSRRRWPRQTNNEERRKNAHRTIATTKNHTIKAQTGENHLNKIFVEQENLICPSRLLFKRVINSEKNSPTVLILSFFFLHFFFWDFPSSRTECG